MSSFAQLAQARKQRLAPAAPSPSHQPASTPTPTPSAPATVAPTPAVARPTTPSAPALSSSISYDLPDQVEIRTSSASGRSAWTKRRKLESSSPTPIFKAGSTIVSVQPHSATLSTTSLPFSCSSCHLSPKEIAQTRPRSFSGPEPRLSKCGGCGVLRFCSKKCQGDSWPVHQAECRGLASLKRSYASSKKAESPAGELEWVPGEAVRALARLVIRRGKEKAASSWWQEIAALQSHRKLMPTTNDGSPSPYAQLAISLGIFVGHCCPPRGASLDEVPPADLTSFGFSNVGEVLDLCAAFTSNTFTLSSPSLTPIGVAISPTVALFNHSCWPNAVVVFPKGAGEMQVVALRDIQEDEEILSSYIDVTLPRDVRRPDLKARYFFDCACELCSRKDWVDPRSQVVSGADGLEEWVKHGLMLLARVDAAHFPTLKSFLTHPPTMPTISSLAINMSATSYPLLPLLRHLSLLAMSSLSSTSSIPTRQRVEDVTLLTYLSTNALLTQDLLPPGHPSRGLALAELGKILLLPLPPASSADDRSIVPDELRALVPEARAKLALDGWLRLAWARDILTQAVRELRVGFGKNGGAVGGEVAGLLEGTEREIEALRSQQGA